MKTVETKKCPSCSKLQPSRSLVTLERFSLYKCSCGLKFISPSLDIEGQKEIYQSSDKLEDVNPALSNYYEYETINQKSVTFRDYTKTLKALKGLISGRRILEVGCGTGGFLRVAKDQGWIVSGIDTSSENIRKAKAFGLDVEIADIFQYSTDERFDVVVLWDVVEHFQTPSVLIEQCKKLLRDGGMLVLATPHDPNILTYMAFFLKYISFSRVIFPLKQLYVIEHTSYFSEKTLTSFLVNNGFNVVKCWKTSTDLKRYRFSKFFRVALAGVFFLASCFGLKNRMIVIAKKEG